MKYMGSKNRHAKEILPIVLKDRKENQWYVEPFVGGFNIIDKVNGKRIGNDKHYYLIELFKAIQKDWNPPTKISEKTYNKIKNNKDYYPPHLVGFVGFGCSYSGKWFGGYARGRNNKGENRNYTDESKRNLLKQKRSLDGVIMENKDYLDLYIPDNSIIYCDPPYENTTKYKHTFDHEIFWEWVRIMDSVGHTLFISEYKAPKDFKCVWTKKVNNSLTKNTGNKQGIESLFTP